MPEETEATPDSSRFMPANVDDHIGDDRQVEEPASDANTMVTKAENDVEMQPKHEKQPEDQLAQEDYPKGVQFVFILLALILSIFMVALDLVRLVRSFPADTSMLTLRADNCRNGYPKDHGRVSQCFPDRMVRLGLLPDCCFIHTSVGQALQVFYPEVGVPDSCVHLRARKSYLW